MNKESVCIYMVLLVCAFAGCTRNSKKLPSTSSVLSAEKFTTSADTPFVSLTDQLAKQITTENLGISVYPLTYADSTLSSPCSSFLQGEVVSSLRRHSKFSFFSRDAMNELNFEKLLTEKPNSGSQKSSQGLAEGGQAILRGRFYHLPGQPQLSIHVEVVDCVTTKVIASASTKIPTSDIPVPIVPSHLEASSKNIADVKQNLATTRSDFTLEVSTTDQKTSFVEGEGIKYRIKAGLDCHIAIIVHQVDGSSVLLFPNDYCRDTFVKAHEEIYLPSGKDEFGFKITAPFGADVVQVIACNDQTALHQKLSDMVKNVVSAGLGVRGISRGIVVETLRESLKQSTELKWSTRELVIQTKSK